MVTFSVYDIHDVNLVGGGKITRKRYIVQLSYRVEVDGIGSKRAPSDRWLNLHV